MGLFFSGNMYEKNGGDKRMLNRFEKLQQTAEFHGVEKEGLVPQGVKSAFGRLVDIISRPNFAVAGVLDVITGTGREGESAGGRVLRELFGSEGDKEAFGEVLEQAGVGKGGELSDLIGENWLTARFDPTARGTMGLAMDIFLDPLTYITFAGGKVVAAGRAGKAVHLNPKGLAAIQGLGTTKIMQEGVSLGIKNADEALKVMQKAGTIDGLTDDALKLVGQVQDDTLAAAIKNSNLELSGAWGESFIKTKFLQEAEEELADRIIKGSVSGLEDAVALRFAGVPLIPGKTLSAPLRKIARGFEAAANKLPGGKAMLKLADESRTQIDAIFSRIPFRARNLNAYRALSDLNWAMRQSSDTVARGVLREEILGGATKPGQPKSYFEKFIGKTKTDDWFVLSRSLDDPGKYLPEWLNAAKRIGMTQEQALTLRTRFKNAYTKMGAIETGPELAFYDKRRIVKNYFPHVADGPLSAVDREALANEAIQISKFGGADIGRFQQQRIFQTIDIHERAAKKLGIENPLNLDPFEVFVQRTKAHMEGVANHEFVRDAISLYAKGRGRTLSHNLRSALRHTYRAFQKDGTLRNLPVNDKDLSKLLGAVEAEFQVALDVERGIRKGGLRTADPKEVVAALKTVKELPKHLQAAFFYEGTRRIKDLTHLDDFMRRYGDVLDGVPQKHIDAVRESMKLDEVPSAGLEGVRYVTQRIEAGGLKGVYEVPRGIAEDLANFDNTFLLNPEVKGFLKTTDKLTNWFKLMVTAPFPAFHVRNAYSNVFASAVDIRFAAMNPKFHAQALDVLLSKKDGTLKVKGGLGVSYQALRKEMELLDIKVDRFDLAEQAGQRISGGKVLKPFEKGGRFIENEARAVHYMTLRRRGLAPGDAAARVKSFLFDYSDLSPTERGAFRRLIPFYTWTSKNIRRQAKNLVERPGEVAAQIKLLDSERGPDPNTLPEWLHGKLAMKLEDKPGRKGAILTGIDIPISNIDVIWKGGVGRTMRNTFAMVNPLLKAPIEIALNMDSFTGRGIRGQQWMGRMGPSMDRHFPKWAKDWINLESTVTQDGRTLYKANGTKVYLLFKASIVSRLTSTGVQVDDLMQGDVDQATGWWKLATGLTFRDMDLTEAQRQEVRNKVNRMEQFLLDRGLAGEFRRVTVPKQDDKQSGLFFGSNK